MIFVIAACPKIGTAIALIKMLSALRTGTALLKCCKTILVVQLFLFCITEHIICFCNFLKIFLCPFIARIHVRMILLGKLTVCFFDLLFIRSFPDTKDIVIISFLHHPHLRIKRAKQTFCSAFCCIRDIVLRNKHIQKRGIRICSHPSKAVNRVINHPIYQPCCIAFLLSIMLYHLF